MFAGGRVSTRTPLVFGQPATQTTWVADTTSKQGSTGPLTFVTVRNEYAQDGRVCIVDENDIVYRTPGSSLAMQAGTLQDEPEPPPREPALTLTADEALLFRFSALAYNAHRIHYDHNWVRQEGYSHLVVHGPLKALMMGELIRRRGDGLVDRQFVAGGTGIVTSRLAARGRQVAVSELAWLAGADVGPGVGLQGDEVPASWGTLWSLGALLVLHARVGGIHLHRRRGNGFPHLRLVAAVATGVPGRRRPARRRGLAATRYRCPHPRGTWVESQDAARDPLAVAGDQAPMDGIGHWLSSWSASSSCRSSPSPPGHCRVSRWSGSPIPRCSEWGSGW